MILTERQKKILMLIIREFIETAEAVGSINLHAKYNFQLSSATIRNEMCELVSKGFLYQKHNSGGRIPTTIGWRYFVQEILQNLSEMNNLIPEDVCVQLYNMRSNKTYLIKYAINLLSNITKNTSVAIIENTVYYAGLSNLVNLPEFQSSSVLLERILNILEDYSKLSEIVNKGSKDEDLNIIIGEESELDYFIDFSVVFSEVRTNGVNNGYIAVIGPTRMQYDLVISAVKNIVDTVKIIIE